MFVVRRSWFVVRELSSGLAWPHPLDREPSSYKSASNRHLVRNAGQCLLGDILRDAGDLKEHRAWLDPRGPILGVGFALAHSRFQRFFGDRLVGEDPDVHLALAAKEVHGGDAPRLQLPRRHPVRLQRLQAVIAEGDIVPARGVPLQHASLLLAELDSLWHPGHQSILEKHKAQTDQRRPRARARAPAAFDSTWSSSWSVNMPLYTHTFTPIVP